MYFYTYVYSYMHITFGLCLPEVKCVFYKWSIIPVAARGALQPGGQVSDAVSVWLARLGGSALSVLPHALF